METKKNKKKWFHLRKRTQVFIPVLFKFEDDSVLLNSTFLDTVETKLKKFYSLKNEETKAKKRHFKKNAKHGFKFTVPNADIQKLLPTETDDRFVNIELFIYYYHHRMILQFDIYHKGKLLEKLDSNLRTELVKYSKSIIEDFITKYEAVRVTNKTLLHNTYKNAKIISYYSYPIIAQKTKYWANYKMNNRIETMFFKVLLPNWVPLSFGSPAYIRISIPSLFLFHRNNLTRSTMSDFINIVYETGLYAKKLADADFYKANNYGSQDPISYYNHLNTFDETILQRQWIHFLDSLSGRISDQQQSKVSRNSYLIGLIGFIFGIAGFVTGLIALLSQGE